jgi:hypothetical protein
MSKDALRGWFYRRCRLGAVDHWVQASVEPRVIDNSSFADYARVGTAILFPMQ